MKLVTTIIRKYTTVYHLHQYKKGVEFLIASNCYRLPQKLSYSIVFIYIAQLQYEPSETSENAQFWMLMIAFY